MFSLGVTSRADDAVDSAQPTSKNCRNDAAPRLMPQESIESRGVAIPSFKRGHRLDKRRAAACKRLNYIFSFHC